MQTSSPSIAAWAIAVFSVAVLFIFGTGLALAAGWIGRHLAHQNLEDSLTQLNGPRSEVGIELLTKVHETPFVSLINTWRDLKPRNGTAQSYSIAISLLVAQRAILQSEWSTALTQIAIAIERLRTSSGLVLTEQELILLVELLERANRGQSELQRIIRNRDQVLAESATLRDRYVLIRNDGANLLGLKHRDDVTSEGELGVYTSGVLEGIPVIDRLNDGILSLEQLKNDLVIAGGAVRIQGLGAAANFASALEESKRRSLELYRDEVAQEERIEDLEDQLAAQKDELERITKRAILSINAHILRITT